MTKQQFIAELTSALAQVDPQTRGEIIADISEHFQEGINHGLSEEEICQKLGQPGQIASQVLEEYNQSSLQMFENTFKEAFGSASKGNQTNDTSRIRGGYEVNLDRTFTDVRHLDVNMQISNIKIISIPQSDSVRVTIQGQSRYNDFIVENNNGCLVVKERQPFIKFEIFNFKTTLETTIYVPIGFTTGDITVKSGIGNIVVSGIASCDNLKPNSSVGNVDLQGCTAKNVDAKSSAGNIVFNEITADQIEIRASAGNIELQSCTIDRMAAKASAGNIELNDCAIDHVAAKASAGNISVHAHDAGNMTLDSSAGEIRARVTRLTGETSLSSSAGSVRLEAREAHGNITASSSAGSVHIRLPKDVNCRIEVKKPSIGSVTNDLVGNPNSPYVLRASTSIGSVKLKAIEELR